MYDFAKDLFVDAYGCLESTGEQVQGDNDDCIYVYQQPLVPRPTDAAESEEEEEENADASSDDDE